MHKLLEQNISETRASLTKTLRRMAEGESIVVVIRKRGAEPQAVIISAPEAEEFFRWKAEHTPCQSRQPVEKDSSSQAPEKPPESLSATDERVQELSRPSRSNLNLPDGWLSPEEYVRHYLEGGIASEKIIRGLKKLYAKFGLSDEEAERILTSVVEEQRRG